MKKRKKSLVVYTHSNWKLSDLLYIEEDKNKEIDIVVEDRLFFSKRKALDYFGCYDTEIKQVRITVEEIT